jgi:hypothetical protein
MDNQGQGQPVVEAATEGPHEERRDARLWLGGLALVTACSWGRFAATGSLRVDENYPSAAPGTALFVAMITGWALLLTGWRGMLLRPPAQPRRLAFLGLSVSSLMLPMLSNDVFSLFAYGSAAAQGNDVYGSASALSASPWLSFVGARWNQTVCVYGPTTLVGSLPSALAGTNPWLALLLLRAAWLPLLVFVMELSLRRWQGRPFFGAMLWLNPLWLLEGPGQMHADLLGVVCIVAGILLQTRGRTRPLGGWISYALAVLGKYSFLVTGFWFWLSGAHTPRERGLRIPLLAVVVGLVGVVCYAPLWRGPQTLLEPLRTLSSMNPGGSLTEVVGDLVLLARGGHIPSPETPVGAAMAADRAASLATWSAVAAVTRLVALAVALRMAWLALREPVREDKLAMATGALAVIAATLASHRFEPWYLLPAVPFFALACSEVWRRWWVIAVALSVAPTFIHLLPRSSPILPVWGGAATGASVLSFLYLFKSRFATLDGAR